MAETSPLDTVEIKYGAQLLPVIRKAENSADDAVSHKGAIGRYQIMPATARQYKFDPAKLKDPVYNEMVAGHILNDLWTRFKGDARAVLIGYNAGPTVARRWQNSKGKSPLPLETHKYLLNGERFLQVGGKPLPALGPIATDYVTDFPFRPEQPKQAPGMAALDKYRKAGFSADEVEKWRQNESQKFIKAGFTPNEIDAYWGNKDPDPAAVDEHLTQNIAAAGPDAAPKIAESPADMFAVGWDMSVAGLISNQSPPQTVLPEDAGLGAKILAGSGQLIGDLPTAVGGFFAGAAAGAPAGPVGSIAGAGFGSAALPQAMREIMLGYYKRGEIHSASDFLAMASNGLLRTGKEGVKGGIANLFGFGVGRAVAPVFGNAVGTVANTGTQVTTYTGLSAAMEGKMPDSDDFIAAATLAAATHIASSAIPKNTVAPQTRKVAEKMERVYAETGVPPWTLAERMQNDRVIRGEVLAEDPSGEPVIPTIRSETSEPAPYKVPEKVEAAEVPITEIADRKIISSYTNGGLYEGASNAQVADVINRRGETVLSPEVVYRGHVEGHPTSEGQTVLSTSDIEGGKSFALAHNQGLAEEPGAAIPVAKINVQPGVKKLNPNEIGGTKPKERETLLTGGRLVKRDSPPVIEEQANGFKYAIQEYDYVPNKGGGGGKGPGGPGAEDPITPPGKGPQKVEGPEPMSPEILNEIAGEFISEPKQADGLLDPSRNYRQWISELGPARAIDQMLLDQGFDRDRQMGLEDMFRQTYASDTRTGYFIQKGALDAITLEPKLRQNPETGEMVPVPSIKDAVTNVRDAGGNIRDWINYMVASRANSKEAAGFESGHPLTPDQRTQLIAAGDAKYARATGMLQQTLDAVLDYGLESGVFSARQVEAMRRENPVYVSFRRISGDEPPKQIRGRGFKVREPVSRFEGDDRRIRNPLLATVDNINQIVRMSDRNRAIGSVITLAERHGLLEDLGLKQIEAPEITMSIAEPGSDTFKPYDISNPTGETYAPFLAQRALRGRFKPNQFMFIRNGKPELWEATDEALATLLRGADSPGEANVVLTLAQKVASMQRMGIVNAADFPIRNSLRDQVTSYINDPHSPPPFLTFARGALDVFKQGDAYWRWVGKGGAGSALVEMDLNRVERSVNEVFEVTGTYDRLWNTVRHPLEAAQMISERIDASSRLGYAKGLEANGIDSIKAATMGRKAFLDFAEKGTSAFVQGWARVTPFLRPTLLGYKQFGEALSKDAGSVALKTLAAVTVPTIFFYAMNWLQDKYGGLPEQEKFKNMPRYYKDGMYILPQVGGVRLRLPYPPVVGPVFGGLTTRFLDHFANEDPEAFEKWAHTVVAQLIPPFIPSVVLPPLEHLTNRNFFTGHPLIPASLEDASGPMQYTEATTEPAKALSQLIHPLGADVSPIVIENYARQWSGSLGMAALKMLNAPFKTEGKPWEMADMPFVGSFLIRNPGMSAQPIQDFFAMREKFVQTQADLRLAKKRTMQGYAGEGEFDQALEAADPASAPNSIADTIINMQAVVTAINHDNTLTKDEKRQFTDDLYGNMIELAKGGLTIMHSLKPRETAPPFPDRMR